MYAEQVHTEEEEEEEENEEEEVWKKNKTKAPLSSLAKSPNRFPWASKVAWNETIHIAIRRKMIVAERRGDEKQKKKQKPPKRVASSSP